MFDKLLIIIFFESQRTPQYKTPFLAIIGHKALKINAIRINKPPINFRFVQNFSVANDH
jgi:hypothetical protein